MDTPRIFNFAGSRSWSTSRSQHRSAVSVKVKWLRDSGTSNLRLNDDIVALVFCCNCQEPEVEGQMLGYWRPAQYDRGGC